MTVHPFTTSFTEYFKAMLKTTAQKKKKKKIPFKMLLLTDNLPGHLRALMDNVLMPINTTYILKPMDQGVILTLKSYN